MRKHYQAPEAEYVRLSPLENITIELEDISNPFDLAVAEDEAAQESEQTTK